MAGQGHRRRHREQTCGQRGKERVGQMYRAALTRTPLYVRQATEGKLLCNRERSPALCDNLDGGLGGSRGRGHMYICG